MPIRSFFDQLQQPVVLEHPPQRIVSLVPSQTELLFDLGLEDQVAGITKFCVHPEHWRSSKVIVGGTKNVQIEKIEEIQPDLIIGNKEENLKDSIDHLRKRFAVWMSDVNTLDDARKMIQSIGGITGRTNEARLINESISNSFLDLKKRNRRVLYLIWKNPWMGVGSATFIHSMLDEIGLTNCLANLTRYPELDEPDMVKLDPEIVMLSTEPYPFQEKHQEELRNLLPSAKVILVDGEMFSWYGSRLIQAPAYFNSLPI